MAKGNTGNKNVSVVGGGKVQSPSKATTFTKVSSGIYKADNGYTIKANRGKNIFTGRTMSTQGWYTYDNNGNRVDYHMTLKEAKKALTK